MIFPPGAICGGPCPDVDIAGRPGLAGWEAALPGDGAGGVTELGLEPHPALEEEETGVAVSLAVTSRECDCAVWGVGRAI